MTKETKIGLLVGLAFIIVVALLLSQHATDSTRPGSAGLAEAGPNVRQSVMTPAPAPAPVSPVETPRSTVPTRGDLSSRESTDSGVGGASGPSKLDSGSGPALPPIAPVNAKGKPAAQGPATDLSRQFPNDLERVPAGDSARSSTPVRPATPGVNPPVTPPKQYVAESGDSVSRIAKKLMGGDTRANREALLKANPNLQGENAVVFAGRTYLIPSAGATAQVAEMQPVPAKAVVSPTTPAALPAGTSWYTVKDNDNLWRIAAHELGDGNLWSQVRDLNKDILKGGETVRVNMRIRLPKPGATASVN